MKPLEYFHVETPESSFTLIGTSKPDGPGHTMLCTPRGDPVMRLKNAYVRKITRQEAGRRLLESLKAPLN